MPEDEAQPSSDGTGDEASAAAQSERELQERLRDPRYLGALSLLCDEAGFLVDSKVRSMVDRLSKDEDGMVKAESVLRSLGITDGPSFDALMEALSPESAIEMRAKGVATSARIASEDRGTGGGAGLDRTSSGKTSTTPAVVVHPDDVIRRLKAFVEVESSAPTRAGIAGPAR